MSPRNGQNRVGVWIAGALGDISTTLMVGTLALRAGLVSDTGLVSRLQPMARLDLAPISDLVFGGGDIVANTPLVAAVEVYKRSRTYSREVLDAVAEDLEAIGDDIVTDLPLSWNVQDPLPDLPPLAALVADLRAVLRAFRQRHGLCHVVLVDLISAEVVPPDGTDHHDLAAFEALLAADRKDRVSPSMVYAYAAFQEGCSHVNFTPCAGANIGALRELARQRALPHCGNDGKTGETLLKTALAPMFAARHLRVMSWQGYNMLGNRDGLALSDPERRRAKVKNKEQVLEEILGYTPHADVAIDYVPSLGDWKTAWDLIHFKGFLDVPMSLQFTWQGCDSILAAPLVLDLVRFSEFAARHGEAGPMPHLASFFKNPMGVDEQALFPQFELLLQYTYGHLGGPQ